MSLLSRVWRGSGITPSTWRVFLLLAVAFFFISHDLSRPEIAGDGDYNEAQDAIVDHVSTGSPLRQAASMLLGVFSIGCLFRQPQLRQLKARGALGRYLGWFAAWACLSSLWADDLTLTIKRLASFVILCAASVVVARRQSLREIILWICFTSGLFLLIGILVEITYGSFQPFSFGYRFSGTQHPNGTGIECGILVLSGVAASRIEKQHQGWFWAAALVGFLFLILTGSRTSLISTLVALAIYATTYFSRVTKTMTVPALAIALSLMLLMVATELLPRNTLSLGRDDPESRQVGTFTGRTIIWQDVSPYIQQRPIIGHGYSGFWTPAHIGLISEQEEWGVPDSHSAYVDYLLTLGAVGLFLYLLCLFGGLWNALRLCSIKRDATAAFMAGLLLFCIVDGFLESAIEEGSLLMFICMIVLVKLAFEPINQIEPPFIDTISLRKEVCLA